MRSDDYAQDACTCAVHRLANEVFLQRSVPLLIIQQRDILIPISDISTAGRDQLTRYAENAPGLWLNPSAGNLPLKQVIKRSQNGNVSENTLQRLIQDITHLILEVLRGDERIEQVSPQQPLERNDLATCTAD